MVPASLLFAVDLYSSAALLFLCIHKYFLLFSCRKAEGATFDLKELSLDGHRGGTGSNYHKALSF